MEKFVCHTQNADMTRALGQALGECVRAGDLIMLRGGLGAGKTTFTQGIGHGMNIRGQVASPTFIVARLHPPLGEGPALIHADAYRIRDLDDLETLDLDSTLDESVTVVEWGEGKTEALSSERLEIDVERATGGYVQCDDHNVIDLETMDDGQRRIVFTAHGTRWDGIFEALRARADFLYQQGMSGSAS
ncbi:tRNA (adenosine(37)-N6)-threonylcarbamoyltransferase complex ATPase subunit type 1 TsaE [Schaalia sp. lx-260]|uniref:tRNA (adenosine(37)-N6)-threonylcarbamoyltransferase complex ATPase subunit type 1 TsaE n=1 Tax=Schaalia sp. lx-260 TaxID=2899082 RepID=UPI001E54FAF7|nr:tRNA (adenosine(37)-N6)-threonylcarbamoyltransferase complex ATPase subunit type 1 TsaE [Schaalia sp. lx-260]MCD4549818.1 tRNA (adenosine(37)-N6)-threonylcarbamoyltransferase complex ATPase subunit type 1 TsaE [Schaalia sp. lx-260]